MNYDDNIREHDHSVCAGCGMRDYSVNLQEIGGKDYCTDCAEIETEAA